MSKESVISVKVDDELLESVETILDDLGLDINTAIIMYLKKVNAYQGIPFDLTLN
ncbi:MULTISPECIES: type II toxin-antitoxin system RelB/DinJ family antitoxin [Aerococcus]|uniref:type II toxin-antitoxin system RelB/DinJ family antitoxin n=1 Tax=Aerococcus TaxID=1375 RepID=UPI0018A7C62A|nr:MULTISPECIES: type II toxin-antitoxin system RelB/DinJ family antitoxin [Aerococcus]MCY3035542.1 type II toxin-antitoxin system RelB/DinJ family antitoxin [Aerococcus sp. Group 2]MCY3039217.1 type II toxin-antitoxin system RelB/DinJ family antitoxin [Aerococcus sp. Group 2]MCY3041118.1 type II toxin-antitoxin system RelB/DinJ family antitoxin [Aerococcus sp. Group 2]MCY3042356.1 type II toxin-antitoxin system RelB/DinJ family antitoxin [Aerococcus sp. Group 2]MDK6521344.1 type II toxin-anti